jgi:hypothetical protein
MTSGSADSRGGPDRFRGHPTQVTRLLVGFALGLSVLVAVMELRALLEARAHRAQADVLLRRGSLEGALTALRLAARWDAPFNVYAEEAFVELERLGGAAEARGELPSALAAYRAIHASAMASRGALLLQDERLRRVDPRIAELSRAVALAGGAPASGLSRGADYLAALRPQRPRAIGILVAWAGFLAWVGGASVFLRRGVDAQGRLVRRVARRGAVFALVGWLVFAIGLRLA